MFILIYSLYNRIKVKYIKGDQTMAQNSSPHTDFSTLQDAPITTSANNKELAKRIKDISQQVLKQNYKLYKALENK